MLTRVKFKHAPPQTRIEAGDIGYVDGYVRGGDNRPYAVVVIPIKGIAEMVPLNMMTVISAEEALAAAKEEV